MIRGGDAVVAVESTVVTATVNVCLWYVSLSVAVSRRR